MAESPFPSILASTSTVKKNGEVREALASNGDDGTIPRNVRHFLYPAFFPDRKRDQIASRLSELGFSTRYAECDHGLIVEEDREVASGDFDNLTEALAKMMREQGWEYDGWESYPQILVMRDLRRRFGFHL